MEFSLTFLSFLILLNLLVDQNCQITQEAKPLLQNVWTSSVHKIFSTNLPKLLDVSYGRMKTLISHCSSVHSDMDRSRFSRAVTKLSRSTAVTTPKTMCFIMADPSVKSERKGQGKATFLVTDNEAWTLDI